MMKMRSKKSDPRGLYSFFGHRNSSYSKWLQQNLQEMDKNVKRILNLIEGDTDSELRSLVVEMYLMYCSLAERYDLAIEKLLKDTPMDVQSENKGVSTFDSSGSKQLFKRILQTESNSRDVVTSDAGSKKLQRATSWKQLPKLCNIFCDDDDGDGNDDSGDGDAANDGSDDGDDDDVSGDDDCDDNDDNDDDSDDDDNYDDALGFNRFPEAVRTLHSVANKSLLLLEENLELKSEITRLRVEMSYLENYKRCELLEQVTLERREAEKNHTTVYYDQLKMRRSFQELHLKYLMIVAERHHLKTRIIKLVAELSSKDDQIDEMKKNLKRICVEHLVS